MLRQGKREEGVSKARVWLADAAYLAMGLPILGYRILAQGKDRHGWKERLGYVPGRQVVAGRKGVWIHCVSLGEANLMRCFVEQAHSRLGDVDLLISSTTDTGFDRASKLYGATSLVFRFPLDFSRWVNRALDRLSPSAIILAELETWPNLLELAQSRDIPVFVVNGRLTERSFRRYRRLRWFVRPMFQSLQLVCAQDQTIAERFEALGTRADRIRLVPSMKFDTAEVVNSVPGAEDLAVLLGVARQTDLWVAGGTGDDEERIILDAHRRVQQKRPEARLAIVPRKPERFEEVAETITRMGFRCLRRSRCKGPAGQSLARDQVVLGDTMGELRKFYSIAKLAFVGRSLVPMGGSDMMEAAGLGRPVLVGPYTDNFAEPMKVLTAAGAACVVRGGNDLAAMVVSLLADEARATEMGRSGQEAIRTNKGASERTLDLVREVLERQGTGASADGGVGDNPQSDVARHQ
jgi:3-deoxy-D-manno-octulosonic-acid transferase